MTKKTGIITKNSEYGLQLSLLYCHIGAYSSAARHYRVNFFRLRQFLFVFTDMWSSDSSFALDSIPDDRSLSLFLENHLPVPFDVYYFPDFKDNYLTKYIHRDTIIDKSRTTVSFKMDYCIVLLYNILNDNLEDFINSVKSIMVYELQKVYPNE